jgi:hypothetical protein
MIAIQTPKLAKSVGARATGWLRDRREQLQRAWARIRGKPLAIVARLGTAHATGRKPLGDSAKDPAPATGARNNHYPPMAAPT